MAFISPIWSHLQIVFYAPTIFHKHCLSIVNDFFASKLINLYGFIPSQYPRNMHLIPFALNSPFFIQNHRI
jgi:hypothetical protein